MRIAEIKWTIERGSGIRGRWGGLSLGRFFGEIVMDEQRMAAYLELIEELLNCPDGQEEALLQENAALVDRGLIAVMGVVAQQMEEAGNDNAEWLQQFAEAVAQTLDDGVGVDEELEKIIIAISDIMDKIFHAQRDGHEINGFLEKNISKINEDLLVALPIAFQSLKEQNQPELIATLFIEFGNAVQQLCVGVRWLNLEIAIIAYQQALSVYSYSVSPEQWAVIQINLGNAYQYRIRGQRSDNLENSIAASRKALKFYNREEFPEDWAAAQNNLSNAYQFRIKGERLKNIEKAIVVANLALEVYTQEAFPEDWAMVQSNLAAAYIVRIKGERAENIEKAIVASNLALEVYKYEVFPEQWAAAQNNLAATYNMRIRGERAENIEMAISAAKLALKVYTREFFPEDWAAAQNNLSDAYSFRIRGKRAENIEMAISASNAALEVYTRESFPEQWALTQANLADAYSVRIKDARVENIEKSISASNLALTVCSYKSFPENWAMIHNIIANAYHFRIKGDRTENIELEIAAYQKTLKFYNRDSFPNDWAMIQNNLSNAYNFRVRGDRSENIEKSISASRLALEVYTREAFPEDWAMVQGNLASSYSIRTQGTPEENSKEAISASNLALEVYTQEAFPEKWAGIQNNLATIYRARNKGECNEDIERAIDAFKQALEIYTHNTFPKECRQTSHALGAIEANRQNWLAAVKAYTNALDAAETLYTTCLLLDSRTAELTETADLPRRAAYAYAKTDQLQIAVATVEHGRARGLTENLQRDRADLEQLQQQRPDLYTTYQDITNQLRNLESQQRARSISPERNELTPEAHRTTAQSLNQKLGEAIAQIRQTPGYETFLQPTEFSDIQPRLPSDNPVVYLIPTPNGSLALIVTRDTIQELWLDGFTETQLVDQLNNTWLSTYNQSQTDQQSWLDAIATVTGQLWDTLMSPLIDRLKIQNHHRATLIPTGYLSLLPLHAAWTNDDSKPTGKCYALDEINFTYAPNAQSLIAARAIADRHPNPDSMLAIENPTEDITYSKRPTTAALESFPEANRLHLQTVHAKTQKVREALSGEYAVVNFYCHGTANFNEPLTSGLLMNDDLLTLAQIFELNLTEQDSGGIRLAILSACETGVPGIELADEAIGLPVGMMQAGVAAVIASLWSVSDLSTSLLLCKFYQLWRNHKLEPSEALRQAQIWLRDSSDGQKKDEGMGIRPKKGKLNLRSFAHPYHWAAFSYLGV
jgi:CHAT domain-containing protein